KSDKGDAHALADMVRIDRDQLRPVAGDTELADRWSPEGPTATLFGEPQGDVYRPLVVAKFGEPLALPAPFDVTIDTAEFPAD
ncbi:hypothetical protein ABZ698_25240, partial [Streptomyces antibioticus]